MRVTRGAYLDDPGEKVEIRPEKNIIPAGNRTRILCLEGKYRNHLTTRMHLSVCSEKDARHGEAPRRNMTSRVTRLNYNAQGHRGVYSIS